MFLPLLHQDEQLTSILEAHAGGNAEYAAIPG
jgi:hypothetical protein